MSASIADGTIRVEARFKSIGETAADLGISASAIRYYERVNLIRPARSSGARWFSGDDRKRLALIVRLRGAGLGVAAISRLLGGSDHRARKVTASGLAAQWRNEAAKLTALVVQAERLGDCPCTDLTGCPALSV